MSEKELEQSAVLDESINGYTKEDIINQVVEAKKQGKNIKVQLMNGDTIYSCWTEDEMYQHMFYGLTKEQYLHKKEIDKQKEEREKKEAIEVAYPRIKNKLPEWEMKMRLYCDEEFAEREINAIKEDLERFKDNLYYLEMSIERKVELNLGIMEAIEKKGKNEGISLYEASSSDADNRLYSSLGLIKNSIYLPEMLDILIADLTEKYHFPDEKESLEKLINELKQKADSVQQKRGSQPGEE